MGTLTGIALNLCIDLGSMAILMMLILPVHELVTCFYLFLASLDLSSVLCSFLSTGLLVRFIPRYFIFLVAITNGIFFLISVSDVSLLVYRNAFDS